MRTHIISNSHLKKWLNLVIILLFSVNSYASHVIAADLFYTWVSGNTYKITCVIYGDCGPASSGAFALLPSAAPQICVYNGPTPVATLNLTIQAPTAGVEITPLCPDSVGHTQCTNLANSTPGIKKFVYSGNYTVSGTSHYWRFIFNGNLGAGGTAGRASAITNLTSAGATIMQLIDTLDNTYHNNNSSPTLTVVPTPFFCLSNPVCYSPGAIDADGDNLKFALTDATNGTSNCGAVGGPISYVGAFPAWPGQPLTATTPIQVAAGSFSFDALTGNMCFTPNFLQRSTAVYNIREYRNDTFIGSCQREMNFLVQTCITATPSGIYNTATAGTITDSTHFSICSTTGPFSIFMNPTEPGSPYNITVTTTGVPAGITFSVVNNGTTHPNCTISGNSTTIAPGTYIFYVTFTDNGCPMSGHLTRPFYLTIVPGPSAGIITGPGHVCAGGTITLTDATAGGTFNTASTNVTVTTGGTVTGVTPGTALISYTVNSPGCGIVAATYIVTVDPLPNTGIITGPSAVCVGSTIVLTDAATGGVWSSSGSHATVSATGVVTGVSAGTATISYTATNACGTAAATFIVTVDIPVVVAPITGPSTVCVGASITLTDATADGTWSAGNANVTISAGGIVTGITSGTTAVTYTVTNSCGSYTATRTITINPLPVVTPVSGPSVVCVGGVITLLDATTGGVWSSASSNATVTTGGIVTGVSIGTATISYAVTNTCGTSAATYVVTVSALPNAGSITGPSAVCIGSSILLSDAVIGGVWSSGSGNATVTSAGSVTGVLAGTATISYSVTNSCGIDVATKIVTIDALPVVSPITGLQVVCVGAGISLTDATISGTWTSTTTNATITAGGVVTGVTAGTTIISYTVTNSCGTAAATYPVTINPLPNAGVITGLSAVCVGSSITLTDLATGGAWTSTSGNATVTAGGVVTGVSAGTTTISYTVINSCGTAAATKIITVNPLPVAGTITGPSVVCVGSSITLTDGTLGGAWTSTTANATIIPTTLTNASVTGVTAGTTTISYTVTNSCGTAAATHIVTVNPLPNAGVITGLSAVCVSSSITLSDVASGGAWSSTSANATVSAAGLVTGISPGTTTISYTVTNSCGTAAATKIVTVNPLPNAGTISGLTSVCVGAAISLTDAATAGVWSSSTANASVTSTGVVSGVTAGTSVISYTVTNSCGTAVATYPVTVNPLPVAGVITGLSVVCVSSSITLADLATGGVWSSISANATVSSGGVVTGVSAGTTTISYTVINVCGTVAATKIITINPLPVAGTITGPASVCESAGILLSASAPGGVWSSTANATVSASGAVTGVTPGTATISYTVTNSCGSALATYTITINPLPVAGTVSGAASVCVGATTTFTDASIGGVWSSSNGNATVGASGDVTGVTAGTSVISYTVTNGCGTATAVRTIVINPLPFAGSISGPANVCVNDNIILSAGIPGGTWSNTANVTLVSAGSFNGLTPGTAIVSYSVTNMCGTDVATYIITVNPLPATPTGAHSVCIGSSATLTDATPGGIWSSSITTNATIGSLSGIVLGNNVGTTTIRYTLPTSCFVDYTFTVNPLPNAGIISGPSSVCATASILLTSTAPGGVWSASNSNVMVLPAGVVIGSVAGTTLISYTVTNMCGTAVATKAVTVDPAPDAGTISGATAVCAGATITLTTPASSGTWSSSNASATVSAGGVVTGVSAGTATISYSVTNGCGTDVAIHIITINPLPVAGTITGPSAFCLGSVITLTNASSGGTWSSSSPIANVTPLGATSASVSGTGGGTTIISYVVTNFCGSATATHPVTIDVFPSAGVISGPPSLCLYAPVTYTSSVSGGTWSSSANATVTATGLVTGTTVGTATITYTVSNTCGSASTTKTVTINPLPDPGIVSGTSEVCVGSSITLTDITPGGTWSSAGSNATITAGGVVTGVSAGTVVISYTVMGVYCPAAATKVITVNPLPDAGVIDGFSNVCIGTTLILTDASTGGTWTTTSTNVVLSTTGGVYGLVAGTAIITYTVSNMCGTDATTKIITINPIPAPAVISGPSVLCQDTFALLSASIPGGVWGTSNMSVATVSYMGLVSGVGGGTVTISYTVSNSFCNASSTRVVTVNPRPNAGMLSHPSPVCLGNTISIAASVPGGTWSSGSLSVAISPTGLVTGTTAGNFYVSYSVSNSCGTAVALQTVTFYPLPDTGTINGPGIICAGGTTVYSNPVAGGVWSGGSAAAAISGTGVVTAISPGTSSITYTVSNGVCSDHTSRTITVNPLPAVTPISGPSSACSGTTLSLADATPGGTWSSTGTAISVNAAGVVSGLSAGTAIVSYTISDACGTVTATREITIYAIPEAGTIAGPATMCVNAVVDLSDASAGGVWSSSNNVVASISSTGTVTGLAAGTALITYTVATGPGCTSYATYPVTVSPTPDAGLISSPSGFCQGAVYNISSSAPGGTWSCADGTIVTINADGTVTAVAPGITTITYTVSNGSCTNRAMATVTINPGPSFTISNTIQPVSCYGDRNGSITTTVAGNNGPLTYLWSDGSTAADLNAAPVGTYTLQVTEAGTQCARTDVFAITGPDELSVVTTVKNDECQTAKGKISLTVSGGVTPYAFQWSAGSTATEMTDLRAGTYSVTVTDINTCKKDFALTVADDTCTDIVIHDAVTPNGDGVNDTWVIEGLDKYPDNMLQVFDKWGDLIFEQRNYNNNWVARGKDGNAVPDGTYFYLLKLYDANLPGGKKALTGSILIRR